MVTGHAESSFDQAAILVIHHFGGGDDDGGTVLHAVLHHVGGKRGKNGRVGIEYFGAQRLIAFAKAFQNFIIDEAAGCGYSAQQGFLIKAIAPIGLNDQVAMGAPH